MAAQLVLALDNMTTVDDLAEFVTRCIGAGVGGDTKVRTSGEGRWLTVQLHGIRRVLLPTEPQPLPA